MDYRESLILLAVLCHLCHAVDLSIRTTDMFASRVVCPGRVSAYRSVSVDLQHTVADFHCIIEDTGRNITNSIFRFTHLSSPADIGCARSSLDNCLNVSMKLVSKLDIHIQVNSSVKCLSGSIKFKCVLFAGNNILSQSILVLLVGQKPLQPGDLFFKSMQTSDNSSKLRGTSNKTVKESNVALISLIRKPSCPVDVLNAKYFLEYTFQGIKCRSKSKQPCAVHPNNNGDFAIMCLIRQAVRDCPQENICHVHVSAFLWGESILGEGRQSRPFNQIFALSQSRAMDVRITQRNHSRLVVTFNKPVPCTTPLSVFQYKVAVRKSIMSSFEKKSGDEFVISYCKTQLTCNVELLNLEVNTLYKVCIQYHSVFDYVGSFSNPPSCIDGRTTPLSPVAPKHVTIRPIAIDDLSWKAVVKWKKLDESSWNGNIHYYRLQLIDFNTSLTVLSKTIGNSSNSYVVKPLLYGNEYSLLISSCNEYACTSGKRQLVQINQIDKRRTVASPVIKRKHKLTEVILISVVGVLFVASASVLVFILRKRKQFKRMRLRSGSMAGASPSGVQTGQHYVGVESVPIGILRHDAEEPAPDAELSCQELDDIDILRIESCPLSHADVEVQLLPLVTVGPSLSTIFEASEECSSEDCEDQKEEDKDSS